jgi:hypothetical protein
MISHQHTQNVIDGKKMINLFPTTEQHRDKDSTFLFEEGDVFGLDVLLTSGEETKVSKASIFLFYVTRSRGNPDR